MTIALWIINALLALVFLLAGVMKLARPKDVLATMGLKWVEDFSAGTVKLIAGLEVLGALGLILPLLTGILPILTPVAAVGLAVVMVGAVVVHARRRENPAAQVVLAALLIVSAILGFVVVAG
jgi:uncharacterized membrane protein YphA (DoxX/SURF4 family)